MIDTGCTPTNTPADRAANEMLRILPLLHHTVSALSLLSREVKDLRPLLPDYQDATIKELCQRLGLVIERMSPPPAGSSEVAAEPVAWAYEELKTYAFDTWEHTLSYEKPELASHHRNIEPLFKHPPVPAAPAPQKTTATPVRWIYELHNGSYWAQITTNIDPLLARDGDYTSIRNIRPLYLHPPVAAEPVDWMDDPSADARWNAGLDYALVQLCRKLDVETHAVCWDAATETVDGDVRSVIGNILTLWAGDDWMDAPARQAAAPTPPAGGGETERLFRQSLADHPVITETLRAAEPSAPASPAGDLNSLSAGATPDEVANAVMQLVWAKPSKALPWREYEDLVEQRFRDVEAAVAALAPAAPRKGPSEEEMRKQIIAILKRDVQIHDLGYGRYIPAKAYQTAALAILTLLTPTDRGEAPQAVGDGWQPIVEGMPDEKTVLGGWHYSALGFKPFWMVEYEKASNRSRAMTHYLQALLPSPDQNRGEP